MLKQHLLISRPGFAKELAAELKARWNIASSVPDRFSVIVPEAMTLPAIDSTVFTRQILPRAIPVECGGSVDAVNAALKHIEKISQRSNRKTGRWTLHVFAADDNEAGKFASKIEKPLMKEITAKLRDFAKRFVDADVVAAKSEASDLILQVFVPSGTMVWMSASSIATGVSPNVGGNLRMKDVKGAPSRSARKLEEAFGVLGRSPILGETAVDLGAAPGGWSLCLAKRGAHVTAVDHAKLELKDLGKLSGKISHLEENGLKYLPATPVDWLCCDMVLAASDSLKVLKKWLQSDLMNVFVMNIKLPKTNAWPSVAKTLELLNSYAVNWPVVKARHLYHDRHEITVMGSKHLPASAEK